MTDYPFQATIVGQTTMPTPRSPAMYSFLKNMLKDLGKGQAIRLVIRKGLSPQAPATYWSRVCVKGQGHSQREKQGDGSFIVWIVPRFEAVIIKLNLFEDYAGYLVQSSILNLLKFLQPSGYSCCFLCSIVVHPLTSIYSEPLQCGLYPHTPAPS